MTLRGCVSGVFVGVSSILLLSTLGDPDAVANAAGDARADGEQQTKAVEVESALIQRWERDRLEFMRLTEVVTDAMSRAERQHALVRDKPIRSIETQKKEGEYLAAKRARMTAEHVYTTFLERGQKEESSEVQKQVDIAEELVNRHEQRLRRVDQTRKEVQERLDEAAKSATPADLVAKLTLERMSEEEQLKRAEAQASLADAKATRDQFINRVQRPKMLKLREDAEAKRGDELEAQVALQSAQIEESNTLKAIAALNLSASEKNLLELLNQAAQIAIPDPTIQEPARLQQTLEKLESKLAEARAYEERTRGIRGMQQFRAMTSQIENALKEEP